jgi:hypothetical protein
MHKGVRSDGDDKQPRQERDFQDDKFIFIREILFKSDLGRRHRTHAREYLTLCRCDQEFKRSDQERDLQERKTLISPTAADLKTEEPVSCMLSRHEGGRELDHLYQDMDCLPGRFSESPSHAS